MYCVPGIQCGVPGIQCVPGIECPEFNVGMVLEGPYTTVSPGVRVYIQNIGFNVGTDRYTGRPAGLMTVWIQNLNSIDGFWSVANAYPGPS